MPRAARLIALLVLVAALAAAAPAAGASKSRKIQWIHTGHIGKKGDGPGKFPGATGAVAVEQDCGYVFIVDPEQKRIYRFSKSGKLLGVFADPENGRIDDPHGMEVNQPFNGRVQFDGPPPTCGLLTTANPSLMLADWGKSQESPGRISFYSARDGSFNGAWCETAGTGCKRLGTIVPAGSQEVNGMDPFPTDVDAKGDRIWIAGAYGGRVREYDFEPRFRRQTSRTANYPTGPSSISVGDAPGYFWATDDSASEVVLFDLDPSNSEINQEATIGDDYSTSTPGRFGSPSAVEVGPAGRFFDDLFVLDGERVQVFTPGGGCGCLLTQPELRRVIELPGDNFAGKYMDVRYDGTIYVTGRHSEGADVYTPGVIITLKTKARKNRRITLSGRIFPPHARTRIRLERLEQGWETIETVPIKDGSRFSHVWRAPRAGKTYAVRAFFRDPHRFHMNRNSEIKHVKAKK